nr:EAL domain-containing protein [Bilophila wadsworthia]
MNRLQEFLDNPHIITGTATVAADPQLTLIAANKALYTLVGETAESCHQQGNSLLPWIEQSSAVRLIGLLAGHPPLFDWEGVLVRKDATSVRIRLSGTRMEGVLHKGQYPVYLSAFTDLACVEEMLRSAEYERRKYALIADISEDLPFEYDFETDTIAYTQKYHKVFGHEPVIPRFRERLGRGEAIDPVSEGFREPFLALDAEKASTEAAPERFLPTHSGRKRWFALYSTNILDTLGKPVKSVGALRDIDRQKREQLRLLDKSRTDSMTGLYNKVTTEEEIRIALRDARPGSSGVLFMIDIDNFKDVNDSMGHLAGDSIIMEIARQLRRTFRQDDIIGRVGGDEFHVYMRDVSEIAGIRTRAQSLCSSIRNLFKNSNIDNAVSVSVGIAVTERPIAYEDLFRQADVALYHAKGNGKNRYEFFGQSSGGDADGVQTSAPLAVNTVRNSIMVDIIDILFSMYDMHEGIDKALHFIGNALRVDKILIFEYSLDGKAVSIAHEWCSDPKWSTKEQLQNVPIDKIELPKTRDSSGIYYCSDFSEVPPEEKTFILDDTISSLLQCDIVRDGHVVGHIGFEERGNRRIWTQQEVDALILMSKIIGEYIRQRRSASLLRESYESTRNILNSLPNTAVYVIDANHRIVYFNDTVARAYPNVKLGVTCFEVFWGKSDICSFCPVTKHGGGEAFTTLHEHPPFKGICEISVSGILWENKEPAHVVLISERLLTPEERKAKAKRDSFARALCESYHYVVDVDLGTGHFELLANRNDLATDTSGDYAAHFELFFGHILPQYRDAFREHFSLEGLRAAFAAGVNDRNIHLEYQFAEEAGPRWRTRIAFAYTQDDGSCHVLQCIRDINEQKCAEFTHRRDEENLQVALQNSYAKIYRMNLAANQLTCLFCNTKLLAPIDVSGEFDKDIITVMKTRVHPRDRVVFRNFFTAETILRKLDAGEELSVEYRKLGLDGTYHWMLALIVPLPTGNRGETVLLVRDVTEKKEEENNYLLALQNNYSEIFSLDVRSRTVTPLFYNSEQVPIVKEEANFSAFVKRRAVDRVAPESLESVLDFYERRLFGELERGGRPECEYRKRSSENGPYRWIAASAQPVPGNEGHALILLRDVTKKKEEENNYLLALQSNYTEIFRLDLEAGLIAPLYYNSEQVTISPTLMPIEEFVLDRGKNRVHPENLKSVRTFYDVPNIMARLDLGEAPQLEYRKRQDAGKPYRWVNATIRAIPGAYHHALLLLSDITERLNEEADFYKALQHSYSEIYEVMLDTDSMRIVHRDEDSTLAKPELTHSYSRDTRTIANRYIHPDDRESFLELFSPENVSRKVADDPRLSTEYRVLAVDGTYHWISILVLPMPGSSGRLLLLWQDINERKRMEETAARLERRQSTVFRQSGDCIIEINLRTWQFHRNASAPSLPSEPRSGDYRTFHAETIAMVHPADRERINRTTTPKALLEACRAHSRTLVDQYRVLFGENEQLWLENRVFFLEEGDDMTAFFIIRDITEQKRVEEERALEEERYNIALRNTYTEIYEIDLSADTPHLVYAADTPMIPVDHDKNGNIHTIAATLIHPEDRERFLTAFIGSNIRKEFSEGRMEVPAEYRRLGSDGKWYWVSAFIVPLCGHDSCRTDKGILLVRDISEQREEEQRRRISEQYDHALRNIYDELYELNITQDSYRIVYHVKGKYVTPPEQGRLSECIDLVSRNMLFPEDRTRFLEFFNLDALRQNFAAGREYLIGEFRKLWHDQEYHWASITMFPVAQPDGGDEIYLAFIMDIGDKKQAEEVAQQNILLERQRLDDERYRTIVEQTDTLVFEWNLETDTRYISPEIVARFAGNYDHRDLMHVWREDLVIHPDDLPLLTAFLKDSRIQRYTEMTARFRKRDGVYIWCKAALTCLHDDKGNPKRYIGTLNDVDSATRSVLALKYRAEFDLLTDLYNMHTFYSQAAQAVHAYPERRYSIVRMDIDRFKVINDLYGLKEGDKLLIAIADLLREKMAGTHSVYGRLGGDVFCLCVDYSRERILALIKELTDRLADYPLPYKIVPSFGICEVDNIDTPINVLCDWANLALKTIKGNYLNSYAFYDGKLRERILEEKKIENQMHDALLQGQFVLYLQPKVHIPTSRIIGSEGLVRWVHPTEGLMPPDRFIPLFEKNGFIIRLDEYIWEQACITLRRWIDHGLTPTPISVNMSRMHIHDPRLREKLLDLMRRYELPPHLLELELTESAFLENESGLFESMKALQAFGFQFSMDDFGSGYSSLNMLKSMPVDFIKIDRGFLNEVVTTERGKTVIRFSISLAREMSIKVIAEGVETEEQAAFLLQAGCAYAQGYFYSRPLPIPQFEALAFGTEHPFPVAPSIKALAEKLEKGST